MTVPYTARCPECDAARTFTALYRDRLSGRYMVGCVVCGTTEREALQRASLDPELTIASQAKVINYMASQLDAMTQQLAPRGDVADDVAALRDELHQHATLIRKDCAEGIANLRDELHAHAYNLHAHGR